MSIFKKCENCHIAAKRVCGCSDSPRYFCYDHSNEHIDSSGVHHIQTALVTLSAEQTSELQKAHKKHRILSVGQAILNQKEQVSPFIQRIKQIEEGYSSITEGIINREENEHIKEICSNQAIPLFSENSLVQSLLNLKQTENFYEQSIQELLFSCSPPLQLSVDHLFSTNTSSTQTDSPSPIVSVQQSSSPVLWIQKLPSQSYLPNQDPQYELFKQKNTHSLGICSIAVSECETYFATASADKTISIWELRTMNLIRTLHGHTDWARSVAFLGDKVVSGSLDTTIKIWEEDQCIKTLNIHSGGVLCVNVSYSKKLIASGSKDNTLIVFNVEDDKIVHTLKRHSDYVRSVTFSSNDEELISGSNDNTIKIWKTDTGELLKSLDAHSHNVHCVLFYEKLIVSSSRDNTVKVWDRDHNEAIVTFNAHSAIVWSVDVANNIAVSLGHDLKIIFWDLMTGRVFQSDIGHENKYPYYYFGGLKAVKDGNFIISAGEDANIKIWRRVN